MLYASREYRLQITQQKLKKKAHLIRERLGSLSAKFLTKCNKGNKLCHQLIHIFEHIIDNSGQHRSSEY